jgi:hypothetical protein
MYVLGPQLRLEYAASADFVTETRLFAGIIGHMGVWSSPRPELCLLVGLRKTVMDEP